MSELLEPPALEAVETPTAKPPAEETREVVDQFMEMLKPAKEPKAKKPKPEAAVEIEIEVEPVLAAPTEDSSEKIAEAVGREVGRVLKEREAPAPEPAPVPSEKVLPELEQERQGNMAALEQLFPKAYKDIAKERAEFLEKQLKREEDWINENPGEDFDPDAAEHDEFFASDPMRRVPAEHLAKAIARQEIMAERGRNDAMIQAVETRARVLPLASQTGARQAAAVAFAIGGKEASALVDSDGRVNQDRMAEMMKTDEVRAQAIARAADAASVLSSEVVKLFNGAVEQDSENNPLHKTLAKFGAGIEESMASKTAAEWKAADGRGRPREDFLTSREFYALSPAKRNGHWTFDQRDMIDLLTLKLQKEATEMIESQQQSFEAEAKRRGYTSSTAAKPSERAVVTKPQSNTPAESEHYSPSSSAPPRMAGSRDAASDEAKKREDVVWKQMWGA